MITHQSPVNADAQRLIDLFDATFYQRFNTRLVAGDDEPVYLPASPQCHYHQVVFAHGFFASALHEVAHWCLAGEKRRALEDYGYWYFPDGRTPRQQRDFEQVEIKPQALEWLFSQACGRTFYLSVDNLNASGKSVLPDAHKGTTEQRFRLAVAAQARHYLADSLPARAADWLQTLQQAFSGTLASSDFYWPEQR